VELNWLFAFGLPGFKTVQAELTRAIATCALINFLESLIFEPLIQNAESSFIVAFKFPIYKKAFLNPILVKNIFLSEVDRVRAAPGAKAK
jgi:hypothetical protein